MSDFMIGRSGGGKNYSVVGGDTQPAAAENRIWLDTSTALGDIQINCPVIPTTRYDGSALQAGDVIIMASKGSPGAFKAMKNAVLYGLPGQAYQYNGSLWVPLSGYIYLTAEEDFVQFSLGETILFQDGDQRTAVTGGWSNSGYAYSDWALRAPTISGQTMEVRVAANSGGTNYFCCVGTANPLDVTAIQTICFQVDSATGIYNVAVSPTKTLKTNGSVWQTSAMAEFDALTGVQCLDVSAVTGNVYVSFYNRSHTGTQERIAVVSRIWGES